MSKCVISEDKELFISMCVLHEHIELLMTCMSCLGTRNCIDQRVSCLMLLISVYVIHKDKQLFTSVYVIHKDNQLFISVYVIDKDKQLFTSVYVIQKDK